MRGYAYPRLSKRRLVRMVMLRSGCALTGRYSLTTCLKRYRTYGDLVRAWSLRKATPAVMHLVRVWMLQFVPLLLRQILERSSGIHWLRYLCLASAEIEIHQHLTTSPPGPTEAGFLLPARTSMLPLCRCSEMTTGLTNSAPPHRAGWIPCELPLACDLSQCGERYLILGMGNPGFVVPISTQAIPCTTLFQRSQTANCLRGVAKPPCVKAVFQG